MNYKILLLKYIFFALELLFFFTPFFFTVVTIVYNLEMVRYLPCIYCHSVTATESIEAICGTCQLLVDDQQVKRIYFYFCFF